MYSFEALRNHLYQKFIKALEEDDLLLYKMIMDSSQADVDASIKKAITGAVENKIRGLLTDRGEQIEVSIREHIKEILDKEKSNIRAHLSNGAIKSANYYSDKHLKSIIEDMQIYMRAQVKKIANEKLEEYKNSLSIRDVLSENDEPKSRGKRKRNTSKAKK